MKLDIRRHNDLLYVRYEHIIFQYDLEGHLNHKVGQWGFDAIGLSEIEFDRMEGVSLTSYLLSNIMDQLP